MRRTSVMLEVSDEIYSQLVEPMKKNKSFAKLIASLLDGYLNDEYVRSFAEDGIVEMRKASVSQLDSTIERMQESLSNMGFFTDELQSVATSAHSHFKSKAEAQSKVVGENTVQQPTEYGNEIAELKEQMSEQMSAVSAINNQMSNLMSMFTSFMSGSNIQPVEPNSNNNTVKVTKTVEELTKESVVEHVEDDAKKDTETISVEEDEDASVKDEAALKAMDSLLQDNMFQF